MGTNASTIRTTAALAISALCLFLAVRSIHLDEFLAAFAALNPWALFPALGCYFVSFGFRSLRWRFMLQGAGGLTARRLFPYLVIGYMANNLLPARLGEFVRAYVTGTRESLSRSSVFASIVIERFFDGLTIVMILLVLFFIEGVDRPWLRTMAWLSSALFAGGLLAMSLLLWRRAAALALARKLLALLPARWGELALHILERFTDGLAFLRAPKALLAAFLLSFLVWACELGVYLVYLNAFGLSAPPEAALLTLVVVNLSSLIPSSPAFIGVFQYACQKSLEIFGIGASSALAFSVAVHATQILPTTLLGLFFLSTFGLSMRQLRRAKLGP